MSLYVLLRESCKNRQTARPTNHQLQRNNSKTYQLVCPRLKNKKTAEVALEIKENYRTNSTSEKNVGQKWRIFVR